MISSLIIAFLFLQTPNFPDLPSPTPFSTPTANPTSSAVSTTVSIPQNQILNQLSTVEAESQAIATQVIVANGQLYYRGAPVLPNEDGAQLWSFWKWLSGTGAYSLFGVFQPIMIHLGALVLLALIGLFLYFSQLVISLIIKFSLWLWDTIGKMIPG